jgi:hypothetical protein
VSGNQAVSGDRISRVLGEFETEDIGDRAAEISLFFGCDSVVEIRSILREQVEIEVSTISDLVADADAFDVIELMRMREFPPIADPRVTAPGGSALAIEIVAAVLLSRHCRKPSDLPRMETRPHEQIEELHSRVKRLARLATYRQIAEARLSDHPLAQMAAEYQAAVLNIRNLQYDHIRNDLEHRLFRHPVVENLMRRHLGYGYDDVLRTREALQELSSGRMAALRDETGDIMLRHQHVAPEDMPADVAAQFVDAMIQFMFLPGERATIKASEIAAGGLVTEEMATTVLNSYSQTFDDSISAGTRVFDLLTGTNPFLTTPLLADGAGGYAATANDPGLDSLRRILERTLTSTQTDMRRYDQRARQPVSESAAVEFIERVLTPTSQHVGFFYHAPKQNQTLENVDAQCTELNRVADRVEGDGLFLVDDVAIIVEVKAKSIAAQARRGDVRRLESDLKATIGDANHQVLRLQRLIETNDGIWLDKDSWLDLSHVREIRSVIVLLDDVGPLGTAIGALQAAGLLAEQRPPWVVSLHDLAVITEICDRPSEFLLYLRRRTDSGVATYYRSADELDLFMLFLDGNLYVENDPDEVNRAHPSTPPATTRDRRRHREDAVKTMVADQCQPLDEWFARDQTPDSEPQPLKPTFNTANAIVPIIDAIEARKEPGWLRCATDFLALAGETQTKLAKAVKECCRRTKADGMYHDGLMSFAGLWGHPVLFIAVTPASTDVAASSARLAQYMRAKTYQLQADRAYGLLFDATGQLIKFDYQTKPPVTDPELDRLIGVMNLQPVGRASRRPVQPARRPTKRPRRKKRR